MMRSLYSGISGLSVHQTKMDVIGNNIANVNTVGFKASSVTFSDVFYQTIQSATGPNTATGAAGQNAKQIGLGSTVSSIVASPTKTGGAQRTDNPFDIMINGDSFFIVKSAGVNYFTKAGNFKVDANGTLCTTTGATVMGWEAKDGEIVQDAVKELHVMSAENLFSEPVATTKTYVSGNIDKNSTDVQLDGNGSVVIVSFYDTLGQEYNAKFVVKQNTANDATKYSINLEDIYDANTKKSIKNKGSFANQNFSFDENTGELKTTGTPPEISFDPETGKLAANSLKAFDLKIEFTDGNAAFADGINIDFSTVTMYANGGVTNLESTMGDLNGDGRGRKAGNMTGLSVDTSGKIYGTYDNGDKKLLGQIAVASFSNPAGLEAVGNNMFAETQNSGKFDGVGHDVTSDGGSFTTGVLEMSNVDLASEFTEMITTQRGFQANSRIITTSDTLLEELINLKR